MKQVFLLIIPMSILVVAWNSAHGGEFVRLSDFTHDPTNHDDGDVAQTSSQSVAFSPPRWIGANGRESPETYPTVNLTGFFQADAAWFGQDALSRQTLGDIPDLTDFRRTRLAGKGRVAENVSYMIEMDFAFPGRPSFMDVYLQIEDPSGIDWRVGQWRQPFGMDALTSVKELSFLERGLPFAFLPFRQTGIGFQTANINQNATWAFSGYRFAADSFGGSFGDAGYGMSTRITVTPWEDEQYADVVHAGVNYSLNSPANGTTRIRTTPEIGFTLGDFNGMATTVPFFIDTGALNVDQLQLAGIELASAWGPFLVQSEFIYSILQQQGGPTLYFPGAYSQASYVLTGESQNYNSKQGVFTRVVPDNDLGVAGNGAWEVAARWSWMDLNEANVDGGSLQDVTLGLNWYLNQFTKVQFNYIHAFLAHPAQGNIGTDVVATRAQIDF